MKSHLPKNWPKKKIYSPESVGIDTSITLLRLALFSDKPEDQNKIVPCIEEKRAHPHLEIRKITSSMTVFDGKPHPLTFFNTPNGEEQYGVFANKRIEKDTALGEYVGEVRPLTYEAAQLEKNSAYSWVLYKNQIYWHINGNNLANEMAYINDYRGVKETPNASHTWFMHRGYYYFGYIALRTIEPGDEIVVDYGPEWDALFS
jgi:hypothetical protein